MMYSWSKIINTLADAFKLVHQSLVKVKKFKVLLYNVECEVSKINKITDIHKDTDGSNNIKYSSRNVLNKTSRNYTSMGTC